MSHTFSNSLIITAMFLVSFVVLWEVRRAVKTGVTGLKSWPLAVRAERPIWFWLCMVFLSTVGAISLSLAISGLVIVLS